MVFSSIPAYHDPSNWQQQPNQSTPGTHHNNSQFLPPPLPPPQTLPPPSQPHGVGGSGSIRPGSMADRARMANVPLPEAALKCPRCESTNTKFCYFNNYSLTQPRHFCKTCRRYWTRGGALRNVPVGGGCRRNKRSKGSSSSKSPVSSDRQTGSSTPSGSSSSSLPSNNTLAPPDIIGLTNQVPSLRLMAPLHHHLTDFAEMGFNYGLNYAAMGGAGDFNFQIGSSSTGSLGRLPTDGMMDHQWRLQQASQFPFMATAGLDPSQPPPPAGLFESGGVDALGYHHHLRTKSNTSALASQLASVKMEDHQSTEMNLSKQLLGINSNINPANDDNQYWSGGGGTSNTTAWTDLSGFSSSSTTSNPL